jgi:xylan 1,4-beta-xylosidase
MTESTISRRGQRAPAAATALLAILSAVLGGVAGAQGSGAGSAPSDPLPPRGPGGASAGAAPSRDAPMPANVTRTAPPRDESAGLRRLTVDASKTDGRLHSLQGVNGAPAPGFHKPIRFQFGGWNVPEETDATPGYRQARIDLIRTHDAYGPGDIDAIFPEAPNTLIDGARTALSIFPNPDADPDDPKSYHFGPTDKLIASIKGIGAEVIFRLGRSEGSNVDPPKDFDRYAEVARHIVLHYNRGWANGFHYDIRYWEVWNEPDLGRLFWGGTAPEYFTLYEKIARAVKKADRRALVGGPAISRPNDDAKNPWLDDFLEYVRAKKLPLDFYSWHWYATDSADPQDIVRIGENIRTRLDKHGFRRTLSMVNEWNYGLMEQLPSDMHRASFITSSLIYMQRAPIDLAALYRADNVFGSEGTTPHKTGYALIALGRMKDTPFALKTSGADDHGLAVQAARTKNGDTVQVLISNYQIPSEFIGPRKGPNVLTVGTQFSVDLLPRRTVSYADNRGYDLTLYGLEAGRTYTAERYRVTAQDDLSLVDTSMGTGPSIHLVAQLPPPGIELVVLKKH